jgi:hypothetical protein
LTQPALVVHALARAASAFLSTLARRSPEVVLPAPPELPSEPLSSGLRAAGVENRCPVCDARFRSARICSRCGADLEPLMVLAVKAWQLRQAARQALDARDMERALRLATEAQSIQSTKSGEALKLLSTWLR